MDDELKDFAGGERVRARGFSSVSENIRDLVAVAREMDRLRGLVEEGLRSGVSEPFRRDYFDELRRSANR